MCFLGDFLCVSCDFLSSLEVFSGKCYFLGPCPAAKFHYYYGTVAAQFITFFGNAILCAYLKLKYRMHTSIRGISRTLGNMHGRMFCKDG